MARGHNRTGRSRHGPTFAALYHYMLDSPAWRALSLPARCALVELTRLYAGHNNGRLAMSVRVLAERLGTSKDTAARALSELEERGFVDVQLVGTFALKNRRATEYRLTFHRCDVTHALPSKRFMRAATVRSEGQTVRPEGQRGQGTRSRSDLGDRGAIDGPTTGTVVSAPGTTTGTHVDSTMGVAPEHEDGGADIIRFVPSAALADAPAAAPEELDADGWPIMPTELRRHASAC